MAGLPQEFYKYTYLELVKLKGKDFADLKLLYYKAYLIKYPKTKCLRESKLLNSPLE